MGCAPGDRAELAKQIIVQKQSLDVFTNPNLDGLLARLGADRYVVYGVATDYCVRLVAMGLLRSGKPVSLVTDAVAAVNEGQGHAALREFTALGGTLLALETVCRD